MNRVLSCMLGLALVAACDGDPAPPPAGKPASFPPEPDVLRVVGTGAMTPLAAALATAHNATGPRLVVVVEPNVGSGGGVRAAADGAVDLGLVSRPLSVEERRLGLVVTPVARDAVVLAAHRRVPLESTTTAELLDLFRGHRAHFADGTPATVLLRERDESANAALDAVAPGFLALLDGLYPARRWRVVYHEDDMAEALATTRGAVGVLSLGGVVASGNTLKALALDGVTPSVVALRDGRWRATRDLAGVSRPDRAARVTPFLTFVSSEEGRRVAVASGYVPAGTAVRP